MLKKSLAIMGREFTYMWRDRGLRRILIYGPIIGILLFAGIYSTQVIKDIPTAIVDLDNSTASKELTTLVENAEYLHVTETIPSFEQLEEEIKRGKIKVGVVIPENYGKDLALGRQAKVSLIVDGSNMVYATNATSAVLTVTRTVGAQAGIKTLIGKGIQPREAIDAYQGISIREEAWFNPTLNYAYFLVLGLALNIWQQCCTLAACMNILGETGLRSWIQIKAAGFSRLVLFGSKSIAQIITFMLIVLPVYLLAFVVFKLPLACGLPFFLLFTLAFTIALHSIGTMMSSIAKNSVDASRFGMIVALPSFVVSGYTWPIEAMPQFFQPIVKILPQTWFFQGINYFAFKNPGWEFASQYFLAFGIITVFCYTVAAIATSLK
jgi:ABC-2 type transport system permease protein